MEQDELRSLMSVDSLDGKSEAEALKIAGRLVDLAEDLGSADGTKHAIQLLGGFLAQDRPDVPKGIAQFYLGNAWSTLRHMERDDSSGLWDWQQDQLEHEIMALRFAAQASALPHFPREIACRVFTNLGNALNTVGRCVEAVECWDRALALSPTFMMAQGNKGICLFHYAAALYDDHERAIFARVAHDLFQAALTGELTPLARAEFTQKLELLQRILGVTGRATPPGIDGWPLGNTMEEQSYRKWCLSNRLFLTPLNDLGEHSIAGMDTLAPPSIVVKIGEGPHYPGLFNQIKQEFVSARYLFYDSLKEAGTHFSDRDVFLCNTLDYPAYGLLVEKQKLAFRSAYSLLDKIAFFLNHYLFIGIADERVSFKRLWYDKQGKEWRLRPDLRAKQNWPLRGLFWLSKDIWEDRKGFREAIEPDARDLARIRNHLEHKYLKVHLEEWSVMPHPPGPTSMKVSDKLAYSVSRQEFAQHVLKMLRLSRAAIIYLALGVHTEEKRRASERDPNAFVPPFTLGRWEDDWKV